MTDQEILDLNLIEELDLGSLSEDQQKTFMDQIARVVARRAIVKALSLLEEDKRVQLTELLEKHGSDSEEVQKFFSEHIPDFEIYLQHELIAVKRALIPVTN